LQLNERRAWGNLLWRADAVRLRANGLGDGAGGVGVAGCWLDRKFSHLGAEVPELYDRLDVTLTSTLSYPA